MSELDSIAKAIAKKLKPAMEKAEEPKAQRDQYGTAQVSSSGAFVLIDGAPAAVKANFSVNCLDGDRVIVHIVNHRVVVVSNLTNPNLTTGEVIEHVKENPGTGVIQNIVITDSTLQDVDLHGFYATDGTIENTRINGGVIDGSTLTNIPFASIDDVMIGTAQIEDAAITTAKIGSAAITTAKIDDAAITTAKIENAAITTAKIGDAQITQAKIGSAAVGTANIQQAAITQALIANEAVGNAQILGVSANKLTAGTIDASNINVANLRADTLIVNKINGQPVFGGYVAVNSNASGYSSMNPSTQGWYEMSNGQMVLSQDTEVDGSKAYYSTAPSVAVYDQDYVDGLETQLNNRIDGAIETFTGTVVPTLVTWPYTDWYDTTTVPVTDNRAEHVGDLYYVINANADEDGYCYRFAYDNTSQQYMWVLIKDSDVTAALGRIDDLEDFETTTTNWVTETDTELTQARGSYTSLKGRIEADEGAIATKVETSTFNVLSNTVDSNSATITKLTESVQYGGANLLSGSADFSGWNYGSNTVADGVWSYSASGKTSNVNARPRQWVGTGYLADYQGKTITISFEIMSPNWSALEEGSSTGLGALAIQLDCVDGTPYSNSMGTTGRYMFSRLDNSTANAQYFDTSGITLTNGEWIRIVSKPITINDSLWNNQTSMVNGYTGLVFDFLFRRNGEIHFRKPKIEIGSLATPWDYSTSDLTLMATRITQTESDITLNASKLETVGNPNLSPFFEYTPFTPDKTSQTASSDQYWVAGWNQFSSLVKTPLANGWMHVKLDNTSGSGVARADFDMAPCATVGYGMDYTFLFEFRNNSSTGSNTFYVVQCANNQFWGGGIKKNLNGGEASSTTTNLYTQFTPGTSGVYEKRFVKTSETAAGTTGTHITGDVIALCTLVVYATAGAKAEYDVRVSLYAGEYTGPWKPYSGNQLYASQSELKVANDAISLKASKSYVDSIETANLIRNGDFSDGKNYWSIGIAANITGTVEDDATYGHHLKLVTTASGGSSGNAECRIYPILDTNFTHENAKEYSLSFYAKASAANTMYVGRGGESQEILREAVTTSWKRFTVTYTSNGTGSLTMYPVNAGTLYLAKIMLVHGGKPQEFQPDSRGMATSAELKVQSDRIGMVVSNSDASSSLELTSNAMTYIGQNVNIKGPDGTTTVISGGKVQANSLTIGAISDLSVGGTNLLRDSESMSSWSNGSACTISNGVATLTGSSSNWNGELRTIKLDAALMDGTTKYVISFDYKSTAACMFYPNIAGCAAAVDSASWTRTKHVAWQSQFTLPSTGGSWKRYTLNSRTIAASQLTNGSGDVNSFYMQLYARSDITMYMRHVKMEAGTVVSDYSPAPEDAYDYADSIEVGGRNLLRSSAMSDYRNIVQNSDTDFTKYLRYYNGSASQHTFTEISHGVYQDTVTLNAASNLGIAFGRLASEMNLDPTSYYTLSCWAKCSKSGAHLDIGLSYYTTSNSWVWRGGSNAQDFTAVNTWQYFTLKFKPDADTKAICYCFTVLGTANGTDTFTIRNCKLEKGNKPTDWSIAPEDALSQSSFKILQTSYTNPRVTIEGWAAEGRGDTWTVTSTVGVRIGDTVYLKTVPSDNGGNPMYVVCTVDAVNSSTQIHGITHGWVDTNAAKTATNYITASANDGIKVHNAGDTSTYVQIVSGAIDFVRSSVSTMKMWVESSVAKVRVGIEAGAHVLLSSGSIELFGGDGSTRLAHFGYGTSNAESGTDTAPYYVLGRRSTSYERIPEYSSSSTYAKGDLCVYNSVVYLCKTAITSAEAWNASHWTVAIGNYSVAEGFNTVASGSCSHAEGLTSHALGSYSHAEGSSTTANGNSSHVEGYATTAKGVYSHAQNYATIASSAYQTAIGKFNVEDASDTYALIIGNGAAGARSNALAVKWDGGVVVADHTTAIGSQVTASFSSAVTVQNNKTTNLKSISLPKGMWLVQAHVHFSTNTGGYRQICLNTSSTSINGTYDRMSFVHQAPDSSGNAILNCQDVITVSATSTTWYLNAYQNSGSSLTTTGKIVATRIL